MSGASSPVVKMRANADALTAVRRVLLHLLDAIDEHLPGTVADADPEDLHELRVAVRRTRSVLTQVKGVLPPEVRDEQRQMFAELGRLTGPPRDLDVYVLGWTDLVSPLSADEAISLAIVRTELEGRRAAAKVTLAEALQADSTRNGLARWRTWLTDRDITSKHGKPIGPVVAKRIQHAQDKVLQDGRAITDESDPERLHDLRKDAKKLRYLFECFGGLLAGKPRKAFVSHLKALQENLGEHQDAAVQVAELGNLTDAVRDRPEAGPDVLVAVDRLRIHLDDRRLHERRVFAERFAAYDTKANRKALDVLLDPLRR